MPPAFSYSSLGKNTFKELEDIDTSDEENFIAASVAKRGKSDRQPGSLKPGHFAPHSKSSQKDNDLDTLTSTNPESKDLSDQLSDDYGEESKVEFVYNDQYEFIKNVENLICNDDLSFEKQRPLTPNKQDLLVDDCKSPSPKSVKKSPSSQIYLIKGLQGLKQIDIHPLIKNVITVEDIIKELTPQIKISKGESMVLIKDETILHPTSILADLQLSNTDILEYKVIIDSNIESQDVPAGGSGQTDNAQNDPEEEIDDGTILLRFNLSGYMNNKELRVNTTESFKDIIRKLDEAEKLTEKGIKNLDAVFDGELVESTSTPQDLGLCSGSCLDLMSN